MSDPAEAPCLRLTVTSAGALQGRTYAQRPTGGKDAFVGCGPRAAVQIQDPSISCYQVRLRWHGDAVVLRELHARGGTRLNGERIVGARYLNDGDVVELGDVELRAEVTVPA